MSTVERREEMKSFFRQWLRKRKKERWQKESEVIEAVTEGAKQALAFHIWEGKPLYTSEIHKIIGDEICFAWKNSLPSTEQILEAITEGTRQAMMRKERENAR